MYKPELAVTQQPWRSERGKFREINNCLGRIIGDTTAKHYFLHMGKILQNQMRSMVHEIFADEAGDSSLQLSMAANLYSKGFKYRLSSNGVILLFDPNLSTSRGGIHRSTPEAFVSAHEHGRIILENPESHEGFIAWYRGLEELVSHRLDREDNL